MKSKFCSLFLLVLFILSTCKKDDNPQPVINPDFTVYVDRFLSEASTRGVTIDISHLIVSYSDTLNYYCGWGDYNAKHVLISTRLGCWTNLTDLNKEILMFHELGHAILDRVHDNTKLPNGNYKTMMCGSNQFFIYDEFTPEKRKYYLDELFNSQTPAPSWSSGKTIPTVILKDTINAASNIWKYVNRGGSNQIGTINNSFFLSPGSSLEIKSNATSLGSYWVYQMAPQGIKQSDRLTFSVHVKLDNVTDGGVYVVLVGRIPAANVNTFFTTTQGTKKITGTSGFTEYTVEVPYYVDATTDIYLYLIMDTQATGTAYFDDITLTKYE